MENFGAPGEEAGDVSGGDVTGGTGDMSGGAASGKKPPASHIDILKALADPLRLNMLYALTREDGPELHAKTVKELAAELGEPQTKLYRHIKHLESAGLIQAVASRVVSGIVEHRYQASQAALVLGDDLTDTEKLSPEAEAMAAAALELYRRQYFTARRARRAGQAGTEPHRRSVMAMADGMVPAARAAEIYDTLYQLLDELVESGQDGHADSTAEEMVRVNLLIGYFTADQPAG